MFEARVRLLALIALLAAAALALTTLRAALDARFGAVRAGAAIDRRVAHPRPPVADGAATTSSADPVGVYRGLGTWIDIYDTAWRHPGAAVRAMAARGIRTLYLQTSNSDRGRLFVYRDGVAAFLDAAHRAGIRVVAWYLPGFARPRLDMRRTLAAVRFRTSSGNAFDGYAADIESSAVARVASRTRRLLTYSARLRRAVGPDYPLGAIIPSPINLEARPSFWPRFPYRALARTYDVIMPMTYFTYRVNGRLAAKHYTARNIGIVRERTGDHAVPIHVIGGIGATPAETRGFVSALRERRPIGASYYTFPVTPTADWAPLRAVGPISRRASGG
jgi:hypothetical protein